MKKQKAGHVMMNHSAIRTMLLMMTVFIATGLYGQADSTGRSPVTFIFPKYQLSNQHIKSSTGSFSSQPSSSKYKIHYKIKTLKLPAEPEKPRFHPVDILINALLPCKEEWNKGAFMIPHKQH